MNLKFTINILFLVALLLQIGCGGGGSSDSDGGSSQPPVDYDIAILGPDSDAALVGQAVGLVLQSPESNISDIEWTQTDGDTVNLLSANTKVIGFDVPSAGNYSFSVNFLDSQGGSRSASYSFSASDSAANYINARVDFEVNAKAKASLVAFDSFPGTADNYTWTQIEGPTVETESLSDSGIGISFNAPNVSSDTVLRFRVDGEDDQGNSASDTIRVLVEPETVPSDRILNSGRFEDVAFADAYAYKRNSPYADVIVDCVYGNDMTDYCDFGQLPALGMENSSPTVNEIMDRVVVSHDWMGASFERYLTAMDTNNDLKNMLGAVTAVVISYDVRPSFFWSGTGAIYIDPFYLWETPEERDTMNQAPDFRSNFDEDLQFQDPFRFVKDNDYAWVSYSLSSRATRSFDDYKYLTVRLLIHELAHANDFLPPRVWASQSNSDHPWTYSQNNNADSTGLDNDHPLSSQEMYGLADVMFQGDEANATQRAYTPAQVSNFFFPDDAIITYGYSTEREDYAMLAEEYLMAYRYGIRYDTAITGLAPNYVIDTAQRGRVGHDRIIPRAEYVISRVLPSININEASGSIPAPIELESGVNWRDSLIPPSQKAQGVKKTQKAGAVAHPMLFGRDLHEAGFNSFNKDQSRKK